MLKEELGVLKLENEDLRSARQQQLERFGELSHEQDAMKDNLTSLHIQHREALALAHQNHDAERMALKEAMELVQAEASAARTEIASLTQELQLAQETESGLLAELQGMVNALQDSLAASQQELTTYKDKTKSLQDVCISLRAEWEAVMSECENMRDERDSLRQERDALAKQMHSRGAEAVQLTRGAEHEAHEPMWHEGRIVFLGDRNGTMNLWSMAPDGSDARALTTDERRDAKSPSRSGDSWKVRPGFISHGMPMSTKPARNMSATTRTVAGAWEGVPGAAERTRCASPSARPRVDATRSGARTPPRTSSRSSSRSRSA